MKLYTFDTTLRDGAQGEGISFSIEDRVKIAHILDDLGIDFVEAGTPFSNKSDTEAFERLSRERFSHAKIVAFGATRRANVKTEDDAGLIALCGAKTEYVTVVGKASALQVREVLGAPLDENLKMIEESVAFCTKRGKKVFFAAEHFFDGYKDDSTYAFDAIAAAQRGGAAFIVLCDTNGGAFPSDVHNAVKEVTQKTTVPIAIHAHDDSGMAVAVSAAAAEAGAAMVQGTLNGIGERCGNANLATVIADLQLKRGFDILPGENLKKLTASARAVAEVTNISISGAPYVSRGAFSHKGGMHIDGVMKNSATFEHIDPSLVGNSREMLISDLAGRSAVMPIIKKIMPDAQRDSGEVEAVMAMLSQLEYKGYQFEAAQASLELDTRRVLGLCPTFFLVENCEITTWQNETSPSGGDSVATVTVRVGQERESASCESDGPVHALDTALRSALEKFYPKLSTMRLTDYKVRVIDSGAATGARVRVLIESTDGSESWTTVGVSTDVLMASKKALIDSIEYMLAR